MPKVLVEQNSVFLNIPYDKRFQSLYLAYIVGLSELGLTPKATLAIPGGISRLDRIFALIQSCRYSIHDLSRVQLDKNPPATPRFNMPFELGLAIAWSKIEPARHTWFVTESVDRRIQKSLSDLNGTDPNVHYGSPEGVMRELCNAFVRREQRPRVPQMMESYRELMRIVPKIKENTGPRPSLRQ